MKENIGRLSLTLSVALAYLLTCGSAVADNAAGLKFIDLNTYPIQQVETDNAYTLNIGAYLGNRFSYFSLTNFSDPVGRNSLSGKKNFYTEQNLRWQVAELSPFDLTAQFNFRSGKDNDRHRLGVRWRLNDTRVLQELFSKINMSYSVNLNGVQFDHQAGKIWQLEHVFHLKFPSLTDRLYLSGYADHTFNEELPEGFPQRPVVAEAQLGYRMAENLYVITEYRINEYRRSDTTNLTFGLQYKLAW